MKTKLLSFVLLFSVFFSFSQTTKHPYKRISINNPTQSIIKILDKKGIDLTCGVELTQDELKLELGERELYSLDEAGISYTVLIDDLTKFYSERAVEDLPKASMELKQMKLKTQAKKSKGVQAKSVNELINNVGQYVGKNEIDWDVPLNWHLNDPANSPFETNYFGGCLTNEMVLDELDDMRLLYPNLISIKKNASPTNQKTIEGRTVYYVRISDNPDTDEPEEPETLYQSLIHSREAATVMNQLFFMWYLLENYDSDPAIRNLVNNQALYFIPVYNPDGFVQNQTFAPNGGGGQRKNKNTSAGSCGTYDYGIDLNRNSAYYWGNGGSSTDPCNQTYMGTGPFSENETQIMRDFFLEHDFELALNHHSYKNAMLHAYAGVNQTNPRPDEYSKYNYDMSYYNRYMHGPSTNVTALNSGNMNDWMLGGPAGTSSNGTPTGTGSGKNTMSWTPENGLSSEGTGGTYGGFWPQPSNYVLIAKRAMRMNFLAAYYSGKYAKLHDFTQSNITGDGDLKFGIENLGQKASDFTLTVTAITPNITITGSPVTESFSGLQVLDQRNVNISYTLDSGILPNEKIEYKVTLTNNYASDNVLYEANVSKYYNPTEIFVDADNLTNWTGSWFTTSDNSPISTGANAITVDTAPPYANNQNVTLRLTNPVDLTGVSEALVQYYAKWDLERSFDYVQIEGSINDGATWVPLKGKYTKPGAPDANNNYSQKSGTNNDFQPDYEELYDGDTKDKWVMEEIVIDAATNSFLLNQSNVYFRFEFRTDGTNRNDTYYNMDFEGFTFDDFKVIGLSTNIEQTISFDAIDDKSTTSPNFNVTATASSGLPVTYSIVSGPATISGSTISLTGALGTVVVEASQPGDASYSAAENVTQSFEVTLAEQTVFIDYIGDKFTTSPDFNITANASSGLTVTYAIVSGPATISGNTISLTGSAGIVVVKVSQAGNGTYSAASEENLFEVTLIDQTITFDTIETKLTMSPDFPVSATASSGLPITYSIISGPATISGNTISLTGVVGTVVVEAIQAGNASYSAAENVTQSFDVVVPYCTDPTPIVTYPYNENLNSGLPADWTNADGGWTSYYGTTPSNTTTGPSEDADGGIGTANRYLYTESSSGQNPGFNGTTFLESTCFDLSGMSDADFSFAYHMYGNTMGTLSVEVSLDNGDNWLDTTFKNVTDNQDLWQTATIDLSAYVGYSIKIRFNGKTGTSHLSDMAIDNFSLTTVVDASLGIEDEILNAFTIYPNPSSIGEVKLKVPNEIQEFNISITNLLGQKLFTEHVKTIYNNTHTIKTNSLRMGIYFITVSTDLGKATKKMIINF